MTKNTTASEILKTSLDIYKKRFWPLFLIALIPLLSIEVVDLVLGLSIKSGIPREILSTIITSIIAIWGTLSLYQTIQNKNTDLSEIFQQSWKNLFQFWLLTMAFGLAVAAGFVLFIIPGFLFLLWFGLCFWIYVDQGIGGWKALILSRQYMKDNISYFIKKWFYIFLLSLIPLTLQSIFLQDETIISNLVIIIVTSILAPVFYGYSYLIYQNIKSFNTKK